MHRSDYERVATHLGLDVTPTLRRNIQWFKREAKSRDNIVLRYFGESGFRSLVDIIAKQITAQRFKHEITILEVGVGSGTFAIPIYESVTNSGTSISSYSGLDPSWDMLRALKLKNKPIVPIIGIMEGIHSAIEENRKISTQIPTSFDVVIAILVLHHISDLRAAFRSVSEVLGSEGIFLVVDTLPHMLDTSEPEAHPGFVLEELTEVAIPYFSDMDLTPMDKIVCSSERYSAGTFLGKMKH